VFWGLARSYFLAGIFPCSSSKPHDPIHVAVVVSWILLLAQTALSGLAGSIFTGILAWRGWAWRVPKLPKYSLACQHFGTVGTQISFETAPIIVICATYSEPTLWTLFCHQSLRRTVENRKSLATTFQ
jgi:hypothetical protein